MQSVLQLIACWFGVTHKSGSGCVSDSSACQVALSGLNFLPCLIVSYFVLFGCCLFESCSFLKKNCGSLNMLDSGSGTVRRCGRFGMGVAFWRNWFTV